MQRDGSLELACLEAMMAEERLMVQERGYMNRSKGLEKVAGSQFRANRAFTQEKNSCLGFNTRKQ